MVIRIITFPYSTVLALFLAAASLFLCSFLKCFFVLVYVIFVKYIANVAQRTFEIVQISRSANNNYYRNEKTFKNEQRNRDDAKKRANTSGVGESNNYYEDIYNITPYNNTH